MTTYTIIRALEKRGVHRYTIMTWRSRLLSAHHQAVLETIVVIAVLVLVLLFATVAVGSAQETSASPQPPRASAPPPAAAMKGGMMATCEAHHAMQSAAVKALAKTVADARASRDVAVLHAALEAVAAHLVALEMHVAGCAEKMTGADHIKGKAPAADPQQPHVH
jgi:hypothetical protein